MEVTNVVSQNARRVREQKKLTLDAAAAATGVSRSMLAQLEKGEVNPTISLLWKIADGYKVSFTTLLEDRSEPVSVLRAADAVPLAEDGGRYVNYPVFPFDEKKLFETYRIVIHPGGSLAAQPHLSGSEEYITVFAGSVEITVADETYALSTGDSIRFPSDRPHAYKNPSSELTQLSMIIYYGA